MQTRDIAAALRKGLSEDGAAIQSHIAERWALKRTDRIETFFARSFLRNIPEERYREQVPLSEIGGASRSTATRSGRMDCVIDGTVGLEFKAMRLPRKIHPGVAGARYDLGQVVEDTIRIQEAKSLTAGYTVVFVYGLLVGDAATDGQLYRAFHNQLFVDHCIAKAHGQTRDPARKHHRQITRHLRFDKPQNGFSYDRSIVVVRAGGFGAIMLPRVSE